MSLRRAAKAALLILLLFACTCPLFAADDLTSYLNGMKKTLMLPVSTKVGQTAENNATEEHRMLSEALSQPYGYEWLETYVAPDFRKGASELGADFFPNVLPSQGFVMSVAGKNADNSVSITVSFPSYDGRAVFVIKDNLICALGL